MQVVINVDDSMFENVVKKELEAFEPSELHDVIKSAITGYIENNPDLIKNMFVRREYSRYDSRSEDAPTELLNRIVNKIDFSDGAEEIKDALIKELKENCVNIIEKLMIKAISDSLYKQLSSGYGMQEIMYDIQSQMQHN